MDFPTTLADNATAGGIESFDRLLGGGTQTGTSLLLLGPAGVGKTTLAVQFAVTAARRGQRCAIFTFDETADLLLERTAAV